jgi:exo-beta-1,3-glucanase (GH17 family)
MEPSRQIQLLLISVICIAILLLVSTGCKNGEVAPSPTPISTLTATQTPIPTPTPTLTSTLTPNGEGLLNLLNKFKSFPWIAYSPTHYNPDIGMVPTTDDIKEDLYTLSQSGIRGIVTYSSEGILAEIPRLAHEIGFQGVVMGIWTPGNEAEMEAAVQAAQYVDGYVVGNEGLEFSRYDFDTLEKSVYEVRSKTRKPVTTSEPISQYHKEVRLLSLGDWVFPNTHPYWAGITDPVNAVSWTRDTFDDLEVEASKTPVVLKEVGLPTAGKQMLSEYQQAYYYALLRDSGVHFVYFEAFDQPWKRMGLALIGGFSIQTDHRKSRQITY